MAPMPSTPRPALTQLATSSEPVSGNSSGSSGWVSATCWAVRQYWSVGLTAKRHLPSKQMWSDWAQSALAAQVCPHKALVGVGLAVVLVVVVVVGVAVGVVVVVVVGEGLTVGDGETVGLGDGLGLGDGEGLGDTVGDGDGEGDGLTSTWATVNEVVQLAAVCWLALGRDSGAVGATFSSTKRCRNATSTPAIAKTKNRVNPSTDANERSSIPKTFLGSFFITGAGGVILVVSDIVVKSLQRHYMLSHLVQYKLGIALYRYQER